MLGVGKRTVFRVREQVKASHFFGGQTDDALVKVLTQFGGEKTQAKFDSFRLCTLRPCVHDFFGRNKITRIEKITAGFSEHMELKSLRRCTVHRLLADIGFKHKKGSRNSLLIDRDDITDWQNCYHRDVEHYRVAQGSLPR
ncbi:hypothetical protein HPB51_015570 [Rhipicephalus microplus]|uniref:Uncharacterized protein n=1 Tax=Rhipicephalus microplus TaxID=6941 RepID=A0A9J6DHH2_RHIMP|nr:hypothetical protein HPB51_015570 [Rhipicephalus microplus]